MPEFLDEHGLYRRIHPIQWNDKKNRPSSAAFKLSSGENGLSVDWSLYSTPQESQERAKNPNSGIAELNVGKVLFMNLIIDHKPEKCNYSHTLIRSETSRSQFNNKSSGKLRDIAETVIPVRI
ncbi:MAG: hypothetical protein HQ591_00405 [candidate division Zixibacteria bacterium]|nr:hypothetical protein [Candidatus Tariuqbacter arcticus]